MPALAWLGINEAASISSAPHSLRRLDKKTVKASDRDKTRHTADTHVSSVAQSHRRPAHQDRPRSTPLSGGMACESA